MDKSYLRISQFNVEGVINKKPLLINYLQEHSIDICLLNETWLNERNNLRILNYNIINQISVGSRGGVSILIKDYFKYSVHTIPFYEELQSVGITLHTSIGNLTILCIYCPPPKQGRPNFQSNRLKKIINNLPKPILISGHFNAHHVAFGCHLTNSRGNDIYNMFDECDLCICNDCGACMS